MLTILEIAGKQQMRLGWWLLRGRVDNCLLALYTLFGGDRFCLYVVSLILRIILVFAIQDVLFS